MFLTDTSTQRYALVTGSSRGIGRATALALGQAGLGVAVHYHKNDAAAQRVADAVRNLGQPALVVAADLEDASARQAMMEHIVERWGRLDVLVANAAATAFKPVADLRPYHLRRTAAITVESVLDLAQRARPLMRAHGSGRILAVSSPGSQQTLPRYASLGIAKAGLESLVRYLATEFGRDGITANAVTPGVVPTDSATFYADDAYDAWVARVAAHTPCGRLATPEEVGAVIALLADPAAQWITGEVIHVDGGARLWPDGFDA